MATAWPEGVTVREARTDELDELLVVLDGAMLRTDREAIRRRVAGGDVLVAVRASEESTAPVLGTLVLEGDEITAVAVRRRRRGQGIGRALVAVASRRGPLIAEFDPRVREFYESLGFDVEQVEGADRLRGSLDDSLDGTLACVE